MNWVEVIGVVATVLAVGGVILMNRKRIECFYVWMVSNSLCLIVHAIAYAGGAATGAMIARDAIFLVLAFEGLWMWRKKSERLNHEGTKDAKLNRTLNIKNRKLKDE